MLGHEYMALVGVVLGWLLNEVGRRIWARREEKRAIAQTLAALLEIRHRIMAIPKAFELISGKCKIPAEVETQLKVFLSQLFPPDQALTSRYSSAVALVAAHNPILGFRLNQQDAVLPFLDQLRAIASTDFSAAPVWPMIETELLAVITSHIESLIKQLAWRHGCLTRIRVERLLSRKPELPESFFRILEAVPVQQYPASNQPRGGCPE